MVYVLSALLYLAIVSRYILSPLYGALWFLSCLAISPRYIGFGVGAEGYALSVQRLITVTIALLILGRFFTGSTNVLSGFNRNSSIFVLSLAAISLLSIVGAFTGGDEADFYFVIGFAEDVLLILVSVFIGWRISLEKDGLWLLLKFAFLIPLCICSVLVAIEMLKQSPILAGIVEVDQNIATLKDYYQQISRGGRYRAAALFDGSLQLGEFATYGLIAALVSGIGGFINRKTVLALCGLALFVVLSSGSRSAILVSVVASSLIFYCYVFRVRGIGGSIITWLLVITFGVALSASFYVLLGDIQIQKAYEIEDQFDRSRYLRLIQYRIVPELVSNSPIFGYGYTRNFTAKFEQLSTIDNYYFIIILQSGILGILAFFTALIFALGLSVKVMVRSSWPGAIVGIYVFVLTVAYCLFNLFLSMPDNNMYFLVTVLFGCGVWRTVSRSNSVVN